MPSCGGGSGGGGGSSSRDALAQHESAQSARLAVLTAGGKEALTAAKSNRLLPAKVLKVARRALTRLAPPGCSHRLDHPLRRAAPNEVYSWCNNRFCCDMCKRWCIEDVLYHCDECETYDACAACVERGVQAGTVVVEGGQPSPYQVNADDDGGDDSGDDGIHSDEDGQDAD